MLRPKKYQLRLNYWQKLFNKDVEKLSPGETRERYADKFATAVKEVVTNSKQAIKIAPDKVTNNEVLALIYENISFYNLDALELADNAYKKVQTGLW